MIILDNGFNGKPPEKQGGMAEFTAVGDEFHSEVELRIPATTPLGLRYKWL